MIEYVTTGAPDPDTRLTRVSTRGLVRGALARCSRMHSGHTTPTAAGV
ncbi:hypothetical protein [Leifsonia sp. Root112D2]|nr:hypothetical protein [Leifsonia sp. Root112D2]